MKRFGLAKVSKMEIDLSSDSPKLIVESEETTDEVNEKKRHLEIWNEKVKGQYKAEDAIADLVHIKNLKNETVIVYDNLKKSNSNVDGVIRRGKKAEKRIEELREQATQGNVDGLKAKKIIESETKRFYNKRKVHKRDLEDLESWIDEDENIKAIEEVEKTLRN